MRNLGNVALVLTEALEDSLANAVQEAAEEAVKECDIEQQVEEAVNNTDFEGPAQDAVLAFVDSPTFRHKLNELVADKVNEQLLSPTSPKLYSPQCSGNWPLPSPMRASCYCSPAR